METTVDVVCNECGHRFTDTFDDEVDSLDAEVKCPKCGEMT